MSLIREATARPAAPMPAPRSTTHSPIFAGVAGSLFATRTEDPWLAAFAGTGTAISAETVWEIGEYVAMKAGATGMGLTYGDTIGDMADSALGAIVGGVVTWLRMPREKEARSRGWRPSSAVRNNKSNRYYIRRLVPPEDGRE